MTRLRSMLVLTILMTVATRVSSPSASPLAMAQDATITFNKDVLPILQKNCQQCHRPGEVAPMSFLTYESTRPWAKAIKEATVSKKMPPWFADPGFGDFRNDPRLSEREVKALSTWADTGAIEGDAKDKPALVQWPDGWRIPPDVVISMPEVQRVPAKGSGEIKTYLVANPFKEDTWVKSIEIRPGSPAVVHHAMLQIPEDTPAPAFSWGGVSGATCIAPSGPESFMETPVAIGQPQTGPKAPKPPKSFAILEAVYVPGSPLTNFDFEGSAKMIRGGGDLRIEVHYTPNGKAVSDQTRIGFVLAKEPPQRRFVTLAPKSLANVQKRIPAGSANWETRGELEFGQDAQLVWLMPHMHLRGKDMTFSLIYPNGNSETVLRANFNFDWQLGYELESPMRVRKGTRMRVVAHHDNSVNNRFNPDPTKDVAWGNLTSEEMVLPWFGVIVDKNTDPEKILAVRQGGCSFAATALSNFPGNINVNNPKPTFPLPTLPTLPKRK